MSGKKLKKSTEETFFVTAKYKSTFHMAVHKKMQVSTLLSSIIKSMKLYPHGLSLQLFDQKNNTHVPMGPCATLEDYNLVEGDHICVVDKSPYGYSFDKLVPRIFLQSENCWPGIDLLERNNAKIYGDEVAKNYAIEYYTTHSLPADRKWQLNFSLMPKNDNFRAIRTTISRSIGLYSWNAEFECWDCHYEQTNCRYKINSDTDETIYTFEFDVSTWQPQKIYAVSINTPDFHEQVQQELFLRRQELVSELTPVCRNLCELICVYADSTSDCYGTGTIELNSGGTGAKEFGDWARYYFVLTSS